MFSQLTSESLWKTGLKFLLSICYVSDNVLIDIYYFICPSGYFHTHFGGKKGEQRSKLFLDGVKLGHSAQSGFKIQAVPRSLLSSLVDLLKIEKLILGS